MDCELIELICVGSLGWFLRDSGNCLLKLYYDRFFIVWSFTRRTAVTITALLHSREDIR